MGGTVWLWMIKAELMRGVLKFLSVANCLTDNTGLEIITVLVINVLRIKK